MSNLFQTHNIETPRDVTDFARWLSDANRREETLSIVARDRQKKIVLATLDDAWVIPLDRLNAAVLKPHLIDQPQVKLQMRDIAKDLPELCLMFGKLFEMTPQEVYYILAPLCTGSLQAAAVCINQPVTPHGKFRKLEQDAFDVALLVPQYEQGIMPYYENVGLPLAKIAAEAQLANKKASPDWHVTYTHLWLRVLCYYTGDPLLGRAFVEQRDPITAAAEHLKVEETEAEHILLWAACGRDFKVFQARFPELMPDADVLSQWDRQLSEFFPVITYQTNTMKQSYWQTRMIETRFKRRLRPGAELGEAVAFSVFGTVEDILAVAMATFWNQRPSRDIMIIRVDGNTIAPTIRIVGVGPKNEAESWQWLQTLHLLAPLGNPLKSVPLAPLVVRP